MYDPKILYLDLESFSATPITHGTHVYAANAEILLLAYAVNDGAVKVIEQPNDELTQLLLDNTVVIVAHNAQFDRTVLRHAWQFETDISRWHCTMAQALAHSLPGSLGDLCQLYHLSEDQAKTKDGKRLIQLFCKPQPANRKIERATKETHPEDWDAFRHYAAQDIVSMRELHARMPKWNYQKEELELWHLDQRINDRGVAVDMDLVNGALTAVAQEKKRLSKEANDMTGGAVSSTNQRDAVLEYVLKTHGVTLPDLKTSTIERRINDPDLPEPVRELLRVRLAASMSSTAKFEKFEKCTSADGRLRGTLQYCGASRTGRWCLAEGSLILVKTVLGEVKEVPIEKVAFDDLVWDGCAWVEHEGVVFSGEKQVIEHDGVTATAEHIVFISDTESMPLGEAKRLGLPIWRGN